MRKLFRLIFLLVSSLAVNAAFADQKFGVLMPAVENVGAITYVDNSSGSITIGSKRYELTNETVIHFAPGEDSIGYGKFKFSKDMNIAFEKEKSGSNKESNRISEIWVLHNN